MSIERVLLAIDDSPAALRAATLALDLVESWHAALRIVTVSQDHTLDAFLRPGSGSATGVEEAGAAILQHVAEAARDRGLEVEAVRCTGEPFRVILDQARSSGSDLIIMGRSDRQGPSSPYVGSVTAHVLEFAECPVLVVPRPAANRESTRR